jgi:hypothetical protein
MKKRLKQLFCKHKWQWHYHTIPDSNVVCRKCGKTDFWMTMGG